jgi:hypothetical protein
MTTRSATKTLVTDDVQAIVTASLARVSAGAGATFDAAFFRFVRRGFLGMAVPAMTVVGALTDKDHRNALH